MVPFHEASKWDMWNQMYMYTWSGFENGVISSDYAALNKY